MNRRDVGIRVALVGAVYGAARRGVAWRGVAWRGVVSVSMPRCTSRESRTDRTATTPRRAAPAARIWSYSICATLSAVPTIVSGYRIDIPFYGESSSYNG